MEFKSTKYVEVKLTNEELEVINNAKEIVAQIYNYMQKNDKYNMYYKIYSEGAQGTAAIQTESIIDTIYNLDYIFNIKGVE